MSDSDIERFVRSGEQAPLLEEYFGAEEYREIRELSLEAATARARGGPRVLVLPGIMGSKLGRPRESIDDIVWINPAAIALGRLSQLALNGGAQRFSALGVVLFAYLKLKLRLQIGGFDVAFHPYDWRQDINALGAELAKRIDDEPAKTVHVVAHSMGGLVARAAIAGADRLKKLGRFVMLGTPNFGSFAPFQAFRGEDSLVRKVAALDGRHSAEDLARDIFTTFPGLTQMLPAPERFQKFNFYDVAEWPAGTAHPSSTMLTRALHVQKTLAEADERFLLIAGVNQPTITGITLDGNGVRYEQSFEGDGTVPLQFAQLPDTPTWYVEEAHGSLPNNSLVERAVIDLLDQGSTSRLPQQWTPTRRERRTVDSRELRRDPFEGRRGAELTAEDRRYLIAEVAAPSSRETVGAGVVEGVVPAEAAISSSLAGFEHPFQQVVVGRRRQRNLEIHLAYGSITEVKARAYVLGVFQSVDPAGAAAAVDKRLDGAIKEFTTRRMFSGFVGEVFAMPTGRHLMYADMVLLAGLGPVDTFDAEVQQFVAENIARTLSRTYVDDFATVLLGAGSGYSVGKSLYNHLRGFFRGLQETDHDQLVRRITLCEIDRAKFVAMKQELYRLASTDLFDDFQVTFEDVILPPAPVVTATRATARDGNGVTYLMVRQEANTARESSDLVTLRSTALTPTGKAAVFSGVKSFTRTELDAVLDRIDAPGFSFAKMPRFGHELATLVLNDDVTHVLEQHRDTYLVVVHDAPAARIPWETIGLSSKSSASGSVWFPAVEKGMSRRYAADDLSIAKWMEERRSDPGLRILLIVNPTEDLSGAEDEARVITGIFPATSAIRLDVIEGAKATRSRLLTEFRSGKYDVVHYAGHAQFNPQQPVLSGIVCHGDEMLTGADLAGLSKLPTLMFFNACESGRVRGRQRRSLRRQAPQRVKHPREMVEQNVGLAEAFMRGGVANYIGTYWPVGDESAAKFAEAFYAALSNGVTIGEALRQGRSKVWELSSVDWADYIHYGADDFVLKTTAVGPRTG